MDSGSWILGLDLGVLIQNLESRGLDLGVLILNSGSRGLDLGVLILDSGSWVWGF